jgi:hypothetical protein
MPISCPDCTFGLVWLPLTKAPPFAWMAYFLTVPCINCDLGRAIATCRLPYSCACHACSMLEYAEEWEKVKAQYGADNGRSTE